MLDVQSLFREFVMLEKASTCHCKVKDPVCWSNRGSDRKLETKTRLGNMRSRGQGKSPDRRAVTENVQAPNPSKGGDRSCLRKRH